MNQHISLKALALDSPLRHVLGMTIDFMINVLKNGGVDKEVSQDSLNLFSLVLECLTQCIVHFQGLQNALASFSRARETAKSGDILRQVLKCIRYFFKIIFKIKFRSKPLHQVFYGIAEGIESLGGMIAEERKRAEKMKGVENPLKNAIKTEPNVSSS